MDHVEEPMIRTRREDAVAVVELNRPERLNALTVGMAKELYDVLGAIAADVAMKAVVITGMGRGFCSGADVIDSGLPTFASGEPDVRTALLEAFNPVVMMLREMPQPVVAALNGVAAGIGLSYALACDLIVASRSATLILAFVKLGLVPDGGSSVLVPARAGLGRALEMSLLGDPVAADTALDWGLVNRVTDDELMMNDAMELARKLANGSSAARSAIKRLLNVPILEQLRAQLIVEAEMQGLRYASDEAAEAIAAFTSNRTKTSAG
jgi:2-(1,2-epoxy-1,2-dihydrophenyl)acetyl-CoA isomerase